MFVLLTGAAYLMIDLPTALYIINNVSFCCPQDVPVKALRLLCLLNILCWCMPFTIILVVIPGSPKAQFSDLFQSGGVSLRRPGRSCDIVTHYRLVRYVSSSLIGGSRLFNTLLSVMWSIKVLTNEVCIALGLASNGNTVWLCLVMTVSFISLGGDHRGDVVTKILYV